MAATQILTDTLVSMVPGQLPLPPNIASGIHATVPGQITSQVGNNIIRSGSQNTTSLTDLAAMVPSFAEGGIVPGPLGAPQFAVVHGGETVMPGGGGTTIVQLVLDKRVIGEVALDALHKTARYNAGMVPGSLGS